MGAIVNLYSKKYNEISKFLENYNKDKINNTTLEWKKEFKNPKIVICFSDNIVLRITRVKNNYKYTIESEVTTSETCE